MFKFNTKYSILTEGGFKPFTGVQKTKPKKICVISLDNNKEITCSVKHMFKKFFSEDFIQARKLKEGDLLQGINGSQVKVLSIKKKNKSIPLYDVVGVDGFSFFSEGVVSHNCEFIGSSHTLISASKLKQLKACCVPPIRREDGLDIWEMPVLDRLEDRIETDRTNREVTKSVRVPGNTYAITVDVARGLGLDASAFTVIDVTTVPYRLVAKYRSNKISPLLYPTIIYNTARLYNNAYVLVEISDIGGQIADMLHYELEYENLVKVQMKGKQGQQMSAGYVKKVQFGVKTSAATKRAGCSNLKTLIESDKLLITDDDTVMELITFISQKETYQAEEGYHDDLCMALALFGWFISQRHFRESLTNDIRTVLQHEHLNIVEDDMVPFGIIDDGQGSADVMPDGDEVGSLEVVENWESWIDQRKKTNAPFDSFFGMETSDWLKNDL